MVHAGMGASEAERTSVWRHGADAGGSKLDNVLPRAWRRRMKLRNWIPILLATLLLGTCTLHMGLNVDGYMNADQTIVDDISFDDERRWRQERALREQRNRE